MTRGSLDSDPLGILLASSWHPMNILLESYWDPLDIPLASSLKDALSSETEKVEAL